MFYQFFSDKVKSFESKRMKNRITNLCAASAYEDRKFSKSIVFIFIIVFFFFNLAIVIMSNYS